MNPKPNPKPKKPFTESTGLIFGGSVSDPTIDPLINLHWNWKPVESMQNSPAVSPIQMASQVPNSRKWDCLWIDECNTPSAHLYCGKGCRAVDITAKGHNKCFDGCCRCLRNITELPQPSTQQYYI